MPGGSSASDDHPFWILVGILAVVGAIGLWLRFPRGIQVPVLHGLGCLPMAAILIVLHVGTTVPFTYPHLVLFGEPDQLARDRIPDFIAPEMVSEFEFIAVVVRPDATVSQVRAAVRQAGGVIVAGFREDRRLVIRLHPATRTEEALAIARRSPAIMSAEPYEP